MGRGDGQAIASRPLDLQWRKPDVQTYCSNVAIRSTDGEQEIEDVDEWHESAKPTTRTNFADRAFRCSAPAVWNSLTADIVDSCSVSIFKRKLKTFLFRHSFSSSQRSLSASASEVFDILALYKLDYHYYYHYHYYIRHDSAVAAVNQVLRCPAYYYFLLLLISLRFVVLDPLITSCR